MKTHSLKHHRNNRRICYPLDLEQLAADVEKSEIDLAPTRMTWLNLAQCIANYDGEQGREVFHRIAAVWPDYSRHDSELCYNRALRRLGAAPGISYLVKACHRHGINLMSPRYRKQGKPVILDSDRQRQPPAHDDTIMPATKPIKQRMMDLTLPNGRNIMGRCPLTDLMMNIFPRQQVLDAIEEYLVGFDSFETGELDRSILFWQVDNFGIIHNAKRITYKAGGHRDKDVPPHLIWSNKPQCLFGLHRYSQQNRHKTVAIVESEKSALIMSIVQPQYLWMATGSLNNFNERLLEPIKDATIIAYPDVDYRCDKPTGMSVSFAPWQRTAARLYKQGWKIKVSTLLEETATTAQRLAKIDLADLAIDDAMSDFIRELTHKK